MECGGVSLEGIAMRIQNGIGTIPRTNISHLSVVCTAVMPMRVAHASNPRHRTACDRLGRQNALQMVCAYTEGCIPTETRKSICAISIQTLQNPTQTPTKQVRYKANGTNLILCSQSFLKTSPQLNSDASASDVSEHRCKYVCHTMMCGCRRPLD